MIELTNVEKSFQNVKAVHSLSLTISKGEIHGIVGTSGAGKSTLIRMMNLLERPDNGTVRVGEQLLTSLSDKELRKARQNIGMIFQQFQLVLNRTVAGNVEMPLELVGMPKREQSKTCRRMSSFCRAFRQKRCLPCPTERRTKTTRCNCQSISEQPDCSIM